MVREIRPAAAARGQVRLPASKSLMNRHLNLVLLSGRPTLLHGPLLADDTLRFIDGVRRLGFAVSGGDRLLSLVPGPRPSAAKIDCGASGTMLRFLTATLAGLPGDWTLDGSARLRQRPLEPLIEALRSLGARIEYLGEPGHAPLRLHGGTLSGGAVGIQGDESSQFVSALLMAATRAQGAVGVRIDGLVSRPYVELTLRALEQWGARLGDWKADRIEVFPSTLDGGRIALEADWSSACYLAAGTALLGGEVTLGGLVRDSAQADRRFMPVLEAMGARLRWSAAGLTVAANGTLRAADVDMSDLPDQVPTLAALAPFASGTTRIRNVGHVRLKESDRLREVARNLGAAGFEVEELDDGLVIPGRPTSPSPTWPPVVIDSADDHRIAMSFALVGLRRAGLSVAEPGVVEKSYPTFWRDFAACFEEPES